MKRVPSASWCKEENAARWYCLLSVDEATAHVLSAEEAESHTIHDIVMPLPGFDVIYPTHHGKEWLCVIFPSCKNNIGWF